MATICYFFFKDQDQNTGKQALCALLHQLFLQKSLLIRHSMSEFESNGSKLTDIPSALLDVFEKATSDLEANQVVCVLDALNECAEDEHKTLTKRLKRRFLDLEIYHPQIRIPGEDESEDISQEVNVVIRQRVNCLAGGKLDPQIKRKLDTLSRMLGNCYQRNQRKDITDALEIAISTTELAVSAMPEDHPDGTEYLKTLSNQLGERYKRTGSRNYLDRDVEIANKIINVTP
ncbi:hypothetical protein F4810DRAFT_705292 [Camillea tinctor]|nr:hypothetical protein F4810DRAFT_705292 [Camillea tinctor]